MRRFSFVSVICAILTGCGTTELIPPPAFPEESYDTCGGSQYADLIGQPDYALEKVLILDEVRILRPGDIVTMEYRMRRLNFEIDENGIIDRIYCS